MFIYILTIIIALLIWRMKDYFHHDMFKDYSPNSVPLVKTAFNLAFSTPEEIFMFPRNGANRLKKSFRHLFFGMMTFEICRARDAEKILGSSKHIDKSLIYNLMHPFLKTGLLTSQGEKWHKRRRMLTPAFHFDILKEFFEVFREESDKLVMTMKHESDRVIDIIPVATQFTLNTICESAMGVKLSDLGNDGVTYRKNIYLVGKKLLFRLLRPWLTPDFMFVLLGYQKELDIVLKPVHAFTKSIITQRKSNFTVDESSSETAEEDLSENVYFRSKKRRFAMMDTLLQAQLHGQIDDDGIMEETDTFTFEGHDTTSAAMTYTLLLMAHHPEAQEKIFEEIQEALTDKEELAIDDFNKMEYLDRVLKESMRLYPPVPFISRELSEDLTYDGVTHEKGVICNIHIYDVHRDPEIFPDPEKFDPDRFLPENCADRNHYAFIAFSAGMRNCIGQRFAMLELKVMLTKVIKNFKILPITTRDEVVFIADLVLRTQNPVKMIFKSRN